MKPTFLTLLSASVTLLGTASAKTDIGGCISSATTNQWHEASMIWYVEDTGEICDIPDCGGGRAPPKYDNPACPNYTGTASYEPSYLPGYGPGAGATTTTVQATAAPTTTTESAEEHETATIAKHIQHNSITITSTHIPSSSGIVTRPSTTSTPSPSPSQYTPGNGAGLLEFNAGIGAACLLVAFMLFFVVYLVPACALGGLA
ncbi:putative cell surface protein [Aspergillus undulatus]|uniref:putative cell surface protein n=1 Tax=Aspergillus undulatus TaxID=1810928 RepID=UPI003CCD0AB7